MSMFKDEEARAPKTPAPDALAAIDDAVCVLIALRKRYFDRDQIWAEVGTTLAALDAAYAGQSKRQTN